MRATTTLNVPRDLTIKVTLDMTVGEMDCILKSIDGITPWPMGDLQRVLRESLDKARAAYSSTWVHGEKS
jgi:hypothetical protein